MTILRPPKQEISATVEKMPLKPGPVPTSGARFQSDPAVGKPYHSVRTDGRFARRIETTAAVLIPLFTETWKPSGILAAFVRKA
jgi:hypothetical protein